MRSKISQTENRLVLDYHNTGVIIFFPIFIISLALFCSAIIPSDSEEVLELSKMRGEVIQKPNEFWKFSRNDTTLKEKMILDKVLLLHNGWYYTLAIEWKKNTSKSALKQNFGTFLTKSEASKIKKKIDEFSKTEQTTLLLKSWRIHSLMKNGCIAILSIFILLGVLLQIPSRKVLILDKKKDIFTFIVRKFFLRKLLKGKLSDIQAIEVRKMRGGLLEFIIHTPQNAISIYNNFNSLSSESSKHSEQLKEHYTYKHQLEDFLQLN